ncbi:MAG: hypothetical protein HQ582_25050, partial [Planctomycetes bacterium]|nr:hypothetical protein [Planctomycetota bacterium]
VAVGGQYGTRISGEVHDPLLATALAVETRDASGVVDQAVFVSCDLSVIRRKFQDEVRRRVKKRAGDLDVGKIVISATHTHTAPALTDAEETDLHPYDFCGSWAYRIPPEREDVMRPAEYLDFLAERLSAVVVEAWQARKPGGMSAALGHAVVAHNRRAVYADGSARMYGNTAEPNFSHIEGVSDHSVDVLFFWRDEEHLEGVAVAVYCPAQEVEGERYLSADFWYDTREMLREKYHDKLHVLPLVGAGGDQSPHVMWNKQAEVASRTRRGLSSREEIARRITGAIDAVLEEGRGNVRTELVFQHRAEVTPLPVRKVSDERCAEARALFEAGKDKTDALSSRDYINWRVSRTLMARHGHQGAHPNYEAELHLVRLGKVAIATNPFELYTDYGVRIKARSPADQTMVVQLTSDCAAYLPTRRAVAGGGYSARIVDGVVGPEGGDVLVNETVRILETMWPDD